jgi:MFS family permease
LLNFSSGWAGSLLVSSVCFSFPFAVRLQHRFGFRAIAITSGILVIISFLTTPLIPSANYLFVSYCIPYGIGVGFMDCISITILPEFFDKYLGLAIGMRFASVSIGSMINSYLFPILIESIGWKKMFYCFSSTGAAYLIYAFFYKTKPTIPTDREVVEAKDCDIVVTNDVCELSADRLHILRDRGFQLIVIGCLPFFFAVNVPLMFMVCTKINNNDLPAKISILNSTARIIFKK